MNLDLLTFFAGYRNLDAIQMGLSVLFVPALLILLVGSIVFKKKKASKVFAVLLLISLIIFSLLAA